MRSAERAFAAALCAALFHGPRNFEDMDQNKDGVFSRAEFEASFPR